MIGIWSLNGRGVIQFRAWRAGAGRRPLRPARKRGWDECHPCGARGRDRQMGMAGLAVRGDGVGNVWPDPRCESSGLLGQLIEYGWIPSKLR